jgi:hypothetical protein
VLDLADDEGKDADVVGVPDPLVVGRASEVHEIGEHRAAEGAELVSSTTG